jgi:hypothetical protein
VDDRRCCDISRWELRHSQRSVSHTVHRARRQEQFRSSAWRDIPVGRYAMADASDLCCSISISLCTFLSDYCVSSWFYTPSLGQWALVSGQPSSVPWAASQYGSFRVPSSTNSLPARWGHSAAIDLTAGIIYVTDGATDELSSQQLADVFSYDITSGVWTWISGTNATNPSSVYPPAPGIGVTDSSYTSCNYLWSCAGGSNGAAVSIRTRDRLQAT